MIENPLPKATMTKFLLENVKVDTIKNTICKNDEDVSVEPRLIRVLVKLAENQGEVISRDELLKEISDNAIIGDESLTQAISKIRQYLGDTPSKPQFIKTVPKKGYVLLVSATSLDSEDNNVTPQPEQFKLSNSNFSKFHIAIITLLCLVALIALMNFFKADNTTFIEKGEREFIEKVD